MDLLRLMETIRRRRFSHAASQALRDSQEKNEELRRRDELVLRQRLNGNPSLSLGISETGQPVRITLADAMASSIICGGTGAGKTKAAEVFLREILPLTSKALCGIGVIDCKGDLIQAAIETFSVLDRSLENVTLLNLNDRDSIIPYDILIPRQGETPAQLIARRMAAFDDILGSQGQLSLRMLRMLKYFFWLLIESSMSFASLEQLMEFPAAVHALAFDCTNERVRKYFLEDFETERNVTLPALRYRLDQLFATPAVCLSFSAGRQFAFDEEMDDVRTVLLNLAGAGQTARVFQSMMLSDLREATFARRRADLPFLWLIDEAQVLFERPSDKENLATILSMSRSFGVHVVLITQSLGSTFGDSSFFQNLETNFRWLLLLRSGSKDAAIIRPGLRITGLVKSGAMPGGRPTYLTPEQECRQLLQEIPNLPAQEGYFWLRGSGAKAIRMKTHTIKVRIGTNTNLKPFRVDSSLRESVERRLKAEKQKFRTLIYKPNADQKVGLDQLLAEVERGYQ